MSQRHCPYGGRGGTPHFPPDGASINYVHERHIACPEIKLENILVGGTGNAKQ